DTPQRVEQLPAFPVGETADGRERRIERLHLCRVEEEGPENHLAGGFVERARRLPAGQAGVLVEPAGRPPRGGVGRTAGAAADHGPGSGAGPAWPRGTGRAG